MKIKRKGLYELTICAFIGVAVGIFYAYWIIK